MMGGALGLAVLASLAASRTDSLLDSGESSLDALTGGYHAAFLVGALFAGGRGRDRSAPPQAERGAGDGPARRARGRGRVMELWGQALA